MPRNKDFKRLVRARMSKTGEAFTAARSQILRKSGAKADPQAVAPTLHPSPISAPSPVDWADLAGVSVEAIKARTGCTWERWVHALDRHGALEMSHRDIAALVQKKYRIDDWWSQTVTVGYERIKGLRARGQRRDGTYEITRSRTFDVPVEKLFQAWADADVRRRWLGGSAVEVRTATAPRSMRLDWKDGGIIAVGFTAKAESRSSVAVGHGKLPDRATADRLKQYWSERLDALGAVLTGV